MFEYRPPWAAAMTLEVPRSKRTHLRAGWSAGLGFRPWCRRNKSEKAEIKEANEAHWVSVQDIQERDIASTDGEFVTCEPCCMAWLREYENNN